MSALPHAIPELDAKGLRRFGITTGGIIAVLFGLFFPWLLENSIPRWPWILAGVLGLWGLVAPVSLRPIYRGWMRFGLIMSRITTPIILGLVFFVAVTPMALVRRLFGIDDMARTFDDATASYRVTSAKADKDNLERPF